MPHKGLFTQGVAVLFDRAVELDALANALARFQVQNQRSGSESWEISGPSLLLPLAPAGGDAAKKGAVAVDTVAQPWPDHMGDPKDESTLFGAWSMGHFGPGAYPGGLQRATQQCWHWQQGPALAQLHTAFVRIRTSYAFGAKDDDPVIPENYDAVAELMHVTAVARAILNLPGALCYFNPNGETLHSAETIDEKLAVHRQTSTLPQQLWCNVRLIRLGDCQPWMFMDTVGMSQLDAIDHEAVFCEGYDLSDVSSFLRNVANYVFQRGQVIKDGDTINGPGEISWQACQYSDPLYDPPRDVLRWLPCDGSEVPPALIGGGDGLH